MTKNVADALVETLQAAGVMHRYGIVGDTMNQNAHSLDRSDIAWVHVRHEEAGAFAAAAEALLTGHIAAYAGSCGPGSLQSLAFVGVGVAIVMPIVLAYQAHAYWVFRGKTRRLEGYGEAPPGLREAE